MILRRFCRLRRSGIGAPHVTPTAPEDSNEPPNRRKRRRAYLDECAADFHRILRAFHVHTTCLSISTVKSHFIFPKKITGLLKALGRCTHSCRFSLALLPNSQVFAHMHMHMHAHARAPGPNFDKHLQITCLARQVIGLAMPSVARPRATLNRHTEAEIHAPAAKAL